MIGVNQMNEKRDLIITKENFLIRIFKKIKSFFAKNKSSKENNIEEIPTNYNYQSKVNKRKEEFLNNIKIQEDSGIIYLKVKLENNEIRAIDLTDEQIDELQKIYDKEIMEKQNKINQLKGIA